MKGWKWYLENTTTGEMKEDGGNKGRYNHIGICHETYVVPAGNWETIYYNFTPFGLGKLCLVWC